MSNYSLKIDNLDKWEAWLKKVSGPDFEKFQSRVLRTLGLRGLEYVQDGTPVRSGRLADSLNFGDKDNYFELKTGKTAHVVYGTTADYAPYVEEGFDQSSRKGDFVPGYWSSGIFNYDPDAYPSGMVLTGAVVPGAHMFRNSIDYLKDDIDKVMEFELKRLYDELK